MSGQKLQVNDQLFIVDGVPMERDVVDLQGIVWDRKNKAFGTRCVIFGSFAQLYGIADPSTTDCNIALAAASAAAVQAGLPLAIDGDVNQGSAPITLANIDLVSKHGRFVGTGSITFTGSLVAPEDRDCWGAVVHNFNGLLPRITPWQFGARPDIADNRVALQAMHDTTSVPHKYIVGGEFRYAIGLYESTGEHLDGTGGGSYRNTTSLSGHAECLMLFQGNYNSSDDSPQWLPGVHYEANDRVKNLGSDGYMYVYNATNAGTSSSTGPTDVVTGTTVSDGGVGGISWLTSFRVSAFPASLWGTGAQLLCTSGNKGDTTITLADMQWVTGVNRNYIDRCQNAGHEYQAQNSGTTGGTPPTHTSGTASDGQVIWLHLGPAVSPISRISVGDVVALHDLTYLYTSDVNYLDNQTYIGNEMNVVEAINGNTLTLRRPLDLNYSPCYVRALNGRDMGEFAALGTQNVDPQGHVYFLTRDIKWTNVRFEQDVYPQSPNALFGLIGISGTYDIQIDGLTSETANAGFVVNAWAHVRMRRVKLQYRLRCLELAYGCHDWDIADCEFRHNDSGVQVQQFAITVQQTARHIYIDNCLLDTNQVTPSAIVIAGPCNDVKITRNKIRAVGAYREVIGVGLPSGGSIAVAAPFNVSIEDNIIEGYNGTPNAISLRSFGGAGYGHTLARNRYLGISTADVYIETGVHDCLIPDDNQWLRGVVLQTASDAAINTIAGRWLSPTIAQGKIAAGYTRTFNSAALLNGTPVTVVRVAMPDGSTAALWIGFHIFFAVNAATNGNLTSGVMVSASSSSTGVITAAVQLGSEADNKAGRYASLLATFSVAIDSVNNWIDVQITQTNDKTENLLGIFMIDVGGASNASNNLFDPTRVSFP